MAQENGDEFEPIQEEYTQWKSEQVEMVEAEFLSQKKEFVVCFDTLGEDVEISESDRNYLEGYVKYFQAQWEKKVRGEAVLAFRSDCCCPTTSTS